MPFASGPASFESASRDAAYFKLRVLEEADAAARAGSMAATLTHVALATAYADRCRRADGQAWVAQNRIW